ncbi:hypothetical protein [Streptomyces sp. NPDC059371]|uniref:hypothetical protein n=1 Tax=Streptomyces sp. NPDC059371 TaxID=3346812 RepID=UPI00368CB08F
MRGARTADDTCGRLDDDYPVLHQGQAAEMLGTTQVFLGEAQRIHAEYRRVARSANPTALA